MVPGFPANPLRPDATYVFRLGCRARNKATVAIVPIAAKARVYGVVKQPMCDVHQDRIAASDPGR